MTPHESLWQMYVSYERSLSATVAKPGNYTFSRNEVRYDGREEILLYSHANDAICHLAEIGGVELPDAKTPLNPTNLGKELAAILMRRLRQTNRLAALWDVAGIYFQLFLWLYRYGIPPSGKPLPLPMLKTLRGFGLVLPRKILAERLGPTVSAEEARKHPIVLRNTIRKMPATEFGRFSLPKNFSSKLITDF